MEALHNTAIDIGGRLRFVTVGWSVQFHLHVGRLMLGVVLKTIGGACSTHPYRGGGCF